MSFFDIKIAKQDEATFTGVKTKDVYMIASSSNQRIFIGTKSNNPAAVMIDSNVTIFGNTTTFSNATGAIPVTQSGNNLNFGGNITATTFNNLPQATTTSSGIVQLVSSYTDSSSTKAPTAGALSNLYSWVVAQNYGQGSGGGSVTTNSNNYWNISGCNVFILGQSNLGIRTIPTTPLDVLGDATIRGNISAQSWSGTLASISNVGIVQLTNSYSNNSSNLAPSAWALSNMWSSLSTSQSATSNYAYGTLAPISTATSNYVWGTVNPIQNNTSNYAYGTLAPVSTGTSNYTWGTLSNIAYSASNKAYTTSGSSFLYCEFYAKYVSWADTMSGKVLYWDAPIINTVGGIWYYNGGATNGPKWSPPYAGIWALTAQVSCDSAPYTPQYCIFLNKNLDPASTTVSMIRNSPDLLADSTVTAYLWGSVSKVVKLLTTDYITVTLYGNMTSINNYIDTSFHAILLQKYP